MEGKPYFGRKVSIEKSCGCNQKISEDLGAKRKLVQISCSFSDESLRIEKDKVELSWKGNPSKRGFV